MAYVCRLWLCTTEVFSPVYDYGDPQQLQGIQRPAVWRFHQRLGYILRIINIDHSLVQIPDLWRIASLPGQFTRGPRIWLCVYLLVLKRLFVSHKISVMISNTLLKMCVCNPQPTWTADWCVWRKWFTTVDEPLTRERIAIFLELEGLYFHA